MRRFLEEIINMKLKIFILAILSLISVATRSVAEERINVDDSRLSMLKHAFWAYAAKNHVYPKGNNKTVVIELSHPERGVRLRSEALNDAGEIVDSARHPFEFFYSDAGDVIIASMAENRSTILRSILVSKHTIQKITE